jgi:carbon-monoxide dehydrogenase large subunit
MESGRPARLVGAAVKRKEDLRLIMGEGKYTDDVQLKGMAYMAVLRSPHPHARILAVDTSKACQHPGVLAVLSGEEAREHCKVEFPLLGVRPGVRVRSRWPMAAGVARYVGEPVAAVVAASPAVARDALELIEVRDEPLPAVVDMEKALEPGSPTVHPDLGTNLCVESSRSLGEPDRAFAEADGVVSLRLEQPRLVANPMEPRAVVASYERGSGSLTLWLSSQAPHMERSFVSQVLGLPENRVRVIALDVGGGFGVKIDTYPETVIAAILSMRLGRPVKWTEERQEHHTSSYHGRGEVQYVEAAYRKDSTLLGVRVRFYTDLGAYCNGGSHAVVEMLTPAGIQGAYRVRDIAWTTYGVFTNRVPVGPYRGYGQHASAYLIERVMDLIAYALSMDPVEVRRRNLIPRNAFPYQTPLGTRYDSGDYEAALDRALELADYGRLREEQRRLRERGVLMGLGISTTVDASGFGPSSALSVRPGYETATVRVDASGKATVLTGSSPHGQGMETTFAQIVADELGLPFDDVEVVYGDTAVVPQGSGTRASRSLVVGGTAILRACQQVREKARLVAGALLQIAPQHVAVEGGRFFVEDVPDRSVTWPDVGRAVYGPTPMPGGLERGLEATAYWEPPGYTYPFSANIAVVLVDPKTGEVTLTRYICVDDCGTVVNPLVVEGQVHGGLAQGIGAALLEQAVWDGYGQLLTGSLMDYAMPRAQNLPAFTLDRMATPSPHNPLGAKGMGESSTIAAVPAVANAVVDALAHLGITHIDIPIMPEKVWRAAGERGITTC